VNPDEQRDTFKVSRYEESDQKLPDDILRLCPKSDKPTIKGKVSITPKRKDNKKDGKLVFPEIKIEISGTF